MSPIVNSQVAKSEAISRWAGANVANCEQPSRQERSDFPLAGRKRRQLRTKRKPSRQAKPFGANVANCEQTSRQKRSAFSLAWRKCRQVPSAGRKCRQL
ncbi:hypothetical protein AVEN_122291-1 [Araneus ventricosus]|uniref:Uncharacterized protein n=1 Tax=Araneus ventricosus TaxID=182803 RepID=A0A4Y2MX41_ARAVE|nr:hypothetical protein AVEN_122291-1 [Araneus ventricosus]